MAAISEETPTAQVYRCASFSPIRRKLLAGCLFVRTVFMKSCFRPVVSLKVCLLVILTP